MSLTARDLLRKLADDSGLEYKQLALRVNREMSKGESFVRSVNSIAREIGLDPDGYKLNPESIADEALGILQRDYSRTLMMSAVLARMMESKGKDALPPPAFFAFLELLSAIPDAPRRISDGVSMEVDENTTRIIELLTTLVSLICEWSKDGIHGVARNCPESLIPMARSVFRKTKLYQGGLWTCISCGRIVGLGETRALVCSQCDTRMAHTFPGVGLPSSKERERVGYGRAEDGKPLE
ncbi:MAG: hypothetical protein C4K49_00950 [Candidatus Thorarchaeota archaeon]|nr:MAG: hypothetical protein C4K49_00950 [Candidatus Thorarchaeota archaeon]